MLLGSGVLLGPAVGGVPETVTTGISVEVSVGETMIEFGALVSVFSGMLVGSSSPVSVSGILVGSMMMTVGETNGSSGSVGTSVRIDVFAGRTQADKTNVERTRNIFFVVFLFIEII